MGTVERRSPFYLELVMDNIFLIQFLQGEIDAMIGNNRTDTDCLAMTENESVKAFLKGAIQARETIIDQYALRISQAEKEMETVA